MARRSRSPSTPKGNGHATASAPVDITHDYTDEDHAGDTASHGARSKSLPCHPSLYPTGQTSLSSIGIQAFLLGFTLAASLLSTTWLVLHQRTIWRLPAFFACLSWFHFFEYWTTAHFNTPATQAASFLLLSNGKAYNTAQSLAALEIIVSNFLPSYQALGVSAYTIAVGIVLIVIGQVVRSVAMAQAGTNFNHTPQKVRKEGHVLVTRGVYGWLRHPSYFGFFWWALGTQILVGNKICTLGYLLVLWYFFQQRIEGS